MQTSNEALWRKWRDNNQDPYGKAAVDFAERWANAMELQISVGAKIEDIARDTSRAANLEPKITGFQYGAAVSMLALCWIHGEALRRWHNLDSQLGDEGDRANAEGGVLNPAIVTLTSKED